jgi:uncharacterized metal-binding protein YceD (DUF177 family)
MNGPFPWSDTIRLGDVSRSPVRRRFRPDKDMRATIAKALDLVALHAMEAEVAASPWLDGVEITGRWTARIEQTCGVTLETFETPLKGEFAVRALPEGSRNMPEAPAAEFEIDPDADDPPDVIEQERIDLAAYVVEHLSLEIDPFPRKPGAVFEAPDPENPASPFAVLRGLKVDPEAKS